jgi:hypothetical protein
VRKLESNPVTTSVTTAPGQPATNVVIDGGALVSWLVNMSFAVEDYPHVPAWIGELADGHAENIALSIAKPTMETPASHIGYGLTYGVICSEWVPMRANPTSSCRESSPSRTIRTLCSGRASTSAMCMTTVVVGTSARGLRSNRKLRAALFQP